MIFESFIRNAWFSVGFFSCFSRIILFLSRFVFQTGNRRIIARNFLNGRFLFQ